MKKILLLFFLVLFSLSVLAQTEYYYDTSKNVTVLNNVSVNEAYRIIKDSAEYSPYWIQVSSVDSATGSVFVLLGFVPVLDNFAVIDYKSPQSTFKAIDSCFSSLTGIRLSEGEEYTCYDKPELNFSKIKIRLVSVNPDNTVSLEVAFTEAIQPGVKVTEIQASSPGKYNAIVSGVEKLEKLPVYFILNLDKQFKFRFTPYYFLNGTAEINQSDLEVQIKDNGSFNYDLSFPKGIFSSIQNPFTSPGIFVKPGSSQQGEPKSDVNPGTLKEEISPDSAASLITTIFGLNAEASVDSASQQADSGSVPKPNASLTKLDKFWLNIFIGEEVMSFVTEGKIIPALADEKGNNFNFSLRKTTGWIEADVPKGTYKLTFKPLNPSFKEWNSDPIKVSSDTDTAFYGEIDIKKDSVQAKVVVPDTVLDSFKTASVTPQIIDSSGNAIDSSTAVKSQQADGSIENYFSFEVPKSGSIGTATLKIPETDTTNAFTAPVDTTKDSTIAVPDSVAKASAAPAANTFTVIFNLGQNNYNLFQKAGWNLVSLEEIQGSSVPNVIKPNFLFNGFTATLEKGKEYDMQVSSSADTKFFSYIAKKNKKIDESLDNKVVNLSNEFFGKSDSLFLEGAGQDTTQRAVQAQQALTGKQYSDLKASFTVSGSTVEIDVQNYENNKKGLFFVVGTDFQGNKLKELPTNFSSYSSFDGIPAFDFISELKQGKAFGIDSYPADEEMKVTVNDWDKTKFYFYVLQDKTGDGKFNLKGYDSTGKEFYAEPGTEPNYETASLEIKEAATPITEPQKNLQVKTVNGLVCNSKEFICEENSVPHIVYLDKDTKIIEIVLQDFLQEKMLFSIGEKGKVKVSNTTSQNNDSDYPLANTTVFGLDEIKNGKTFSLDPYLSQKIIITEWDGSVLQFYACQDKTNDGKCDLKGYTANSAEIHGASFIEPNYEAASIEIRPKAGKAKLELKFPDMVFECDESVVLDFNLISCDVPAEINEEAKTEVKADVCDKEKQPEPEAQCKTEDTKTGTVIEVDAGTTIINTVFVEGDKVVYVFTPEQPEQAQVDLKEDETKTVQLKVTVAEKKTERFGEKSADCEIAIKNAFKYDELIKDWAEYYSIDPDLVRAIIQKESSFRVDAIGPDQSGNASSYGLMQIHVTNLNKWASIFGKDPLASGTWKIPDKSIQAGTRYFNDTTLPESVENWIKNLNCDETELNKVFVNSGIARADWRIALKLAKYNTSEKNLSCTEIKAVTTRETYVPVVIAWHRIFKENYSLYKANPSKPGDDFCKPTRTTLEEQPVIPVTPEQCNSCNTIVECMACMDYKFVTGIVVSDVKKKS